MRSDLPPDYYLDHATEIIRQTERCCHYLLPAEVQHFISTYRSLAKNSRRLLIRLSNRKGTVFKLDQLSYSEIDLSTAIAELESRGVLVMPPICRVAELLNKLTKPELLRLLRSCGSEALNCKAAKKSDFLDHAKASLSITQLFSSATFLRTRFLRIDRELRYIYFLAFGRSKRNLTNLVLRDLGLRESFRRKTDYAPRFSSLQEAETSFFYEKSLRDSLEWEKSRLVQFAAQQHNWPDPSTSAGFHFQEKFLDGISTRLHILGEEALELKLLSRARNSRLREKYIRRLYSAGRVDSARQQLDLLLEECDSESTEDSLLAFAEDFYVRKFAGARSGLFSQLQKKSASVTLDFSHKSNVETAVAELLSSEEEHCLFAENRIWLTLFGLLFWEALFEGESALLCSEFERIPCDLMRGEFYHSKQERLENRISLLHQPDRCVKLLRENFQRVCSSPKTFVSQNEALFQQVCRFVRCAHIQGSDISKVMRCMAKNFRQHSRGFPDLLFFEKDSCRFIEIKAEGDQLGRDQFQKLRLLRDCGFSADVLNVRWSGFDDQEYCVVDLETTGGPASRHRVTEFAAVRMKGGEIVASFQSLINPGRRIPQKISRLTGISDAMVAEAPLFEEIADEIEAFTANAVFVAHSVNFDYGFLRREFSRVDRRFRRTKLCTCSGLRKSVPGLSSYSLSNLCEHYAITLDQHHRAFDDALATAQLLKILLIEKARKSEQESGSCEKASSEKTLFKHSWQSAMAAQ